jgi:F-type H+-transporting ATPase subunit b
MGLFVCLALLSAGCKADKKADGHAHPPKYNVTTHGPEAKEETKEFDLSKEEDAKALMKALKDGQVEHLAVSKQPDLFGLSIDLGLWTLVVFLLLLYILRKAAWQPLLQGLQKREDNIRLAAEDAQRARDEAQKLRDQLQAEMNRASEKVREILDEARRDGDQLKTKMEADARKVIQEEKDRAKRELAIARDQALQEVWSQAGTLATMISSKLIRRELTADDHHRLVDEALTELGKANVGWKERSIY